MIRLGLMITEKCNFECGHCMFSCDTHGKDMSENLLLKISDFVKNNDIDCISIYGGEPFLNIELFDMVFKYVYNDQISFFVSTNGSFMTDKKKRDYFYDLLIRLRLNQSECTGVRISNTIYHNKCRTPQQKQWVSMLGHYVKEPYLWMEDNFEEDYDLANPFDCKENLVYIEDSKYSEIANPSGRALSNAKINDRHCNCIITTNDVDEYVNDDDIEVNIRPNGDISVCCTCDGCTIGNILEPNIDIKTIIERIKVLNNHFKDLHDADSNSRMIDLCATCKMHKLTDKKFIDKEEY